MTSSRPPGRGSGPVLISYHQKSGTADVEFTEAYLRVEGVVFWRDIRDFETGTVERNITQAFEEGPSDEVLLLSGDISESSFVPKTEAPLLAGARKVDPGGFQLYIVNTFRKPDSPDGYDFDVPGKQLKTKYPEAKQLKGHFQRRLLHSDDKSSKPASELSPTLRDLLRSRLKVRQSQLDDGETEIGLQTRLEPNHLPADGSTIPEADLHIRLRQDNAAQISEELGYHCLQQALPALIDELHAARIGRVFSWGGYHPSLAWAPGAAPLYVREIEHFTWYNTYDKDWASADEPKEHNISIHLETLSLDGNRRALGLTPGGIPFGAELWRVLQGDAPAKNAVMLLAVDDLCSQLLLALVGKLEDPAALVISLHTPSIDGARKWTDRTKGTGLVRRVGKILRRLRDLAKLHLAVSAPAAMAALTTRWCNTLTIDFHELGNADMGACEYTQVLCTESGNKSPTTRVFPQDVSQVDEVGRLVNPTSHGVTHYPEAGEPFTWAAPKGPDQWVRRQEQPEGLSPLRAQGHEIPITRVRQGAIAPAPDLMSGVGYIMPRISTETARRPDFLFPYGEVRGQGDGIIGRRRLGCFEVVSSKIRSYLELLDPIPRD